MPPFLLTAGLSAKKKSKAGHIFPVHSAIFIETAPRSVRLFPVPIGNYCHISPSQTLPSPLMRPVGAGWLLTTISLIILLPHSLSAVSDRRVHMCRHGMVPATPSRPTCPAGIGSSGWTDAPERSMRVSFDQTLEQCAITDRKENRWLHPPGVGRLPGL